MKNLKNYLTTALALVALAMSSCDSDNEGAIYNPNTVGASFYWAKSSIVLPPDADPSFTVKLARSITQGEATIPLTATEASGLFTIPASVTFTDGAGAADIHITAENITLGTEYLITLTIPDDMVSVTGYKTAEVAFMQDYNWSSIGTGTWTDGLVITFFNAPTDPYPVEVEKAEGEVGMYRVKNPYGFNVYPYTAESEVTKNPCYIVINANDPNAVSVAPQSMGIDWGYSEFMTGSIYPYVSSNIATYPLGTMVGNTIDLGAMYVSMGTEYGPSPAKKTTLVLP